MYQKTTRAVAILTTSWSLVACAAPGAIRPDETVQTRELSAAEQNALARGLSTGLKDPAAAQFKWMPVVIRQRNGITDYCGLLNGKNSYGGYNGFLPFYAQLQQNTKGEFDRGQMRIMAAPADDISSRATTELCHDYGYADFAQAK